jgi:hypothetical protein
MKINPILSILLIAVISIISGCGKNKELTKDVTNIADAMCKNIEIMNKLRAANPQDSIIINKLQLNASTVQTEMTKLYSAFREKYGDKMKDPQFNKDFSNEIRKAMLGCRYLSKEDRDKFEKEIE